ncbi:MAG TPA: FkbM family methyltransferase [Aeromicrobium sp.]|nr:FkbM family methyltransferase [Aeromicrobium sp.]
MKRRPAYALRRVRQTASVFDNGPQLLAQLAFHRVTGRPRELVYRLDDGVRVRCPNVAGARLPIYEVLIDDTYGLPWFTTGLRAAPTVLDIGAHIGSFSLAVCRLRSDAVVAAFEASATTASFLQHNVNVNGLAEQVQVFNVAVASVSGTVEFVDNGSGSVHNGMVSPERAAPTRVPSVTFVEAAARVGERIDLVKIDAEGAEYDFILASDPRDWAGVHRIVMEHHNVGGHHWDELERFFAATGLRVVRHVEHSDRLGLVWLSREPVPGPWPDAGAVAGS